MTHPPWFSALHAECGRISPGRSTARIGTAAFEARCGWLPHPRVRYGNLLGSLLMGLSQAITVMMWRLEGGAPAGHAEHLQSGGE